MKKTICLLLLIGLSVTSKGQIGVTVITHGFQFTGSSIRDEIESDINNGTTKSWALEMARAITNKRGGGKIHCYNRNTGLFDLVENLGNGEVVLIFDWSEESNFDGQGFAESAGDVLFSALLRSGFPLNNLHIIGHSRGTVVNTVAVERFLHLKQNSNKSINVDQVTNIDAHDWGSGGVGNDLNDNHPNYSFVFPQEHQPNNGVISWAGVGFYDSYYQDNGPETPLILHGRPVDGSQTHYWIKDENGIFFNHTSIHKGYTRTIPGNNFALIGGYKYRVDKNKREIVYQPGKVSDYDFFKKSQNRIRGIVNGGLDRGNGQDIPGWGPRHGGGGTASIAVPNGKRSLILSSQFSSRTHNYLFVPEKAKSISFQLYVATPHPNSYITVKLNNSNIYKDTLNRITSGFIKIKTDDITAFQGKVATMAVNITQGLPCVVYVTDFEFSKEEAGASSLFLMDVSGSMNENNKIGQARQAALSTINTIKQESQQSNKTPEIGIMVFSGGCTPNPTSIIQPFTTDLDEAFNSISKIPPPNGGTPLPQAVERAKESLQKRLNETGQSCGTLIVLGDGQSSCGTIIPPDAFAGVRDKQKVCGQQSGSNAFNINLYAVGFGVPPGSVAERELQYLSNSTGGKYFNAQDQYQLTRSFQKINRIYTPIATTQTISVDASSSSIFNNAYSFITSSQQYDTALVLYKKFITTYPTDSSGQYNYALMCEANERYKTAVKYYELYLQSAPNDPNRPFLLERIATLKKDYEIYLSYSKQVILSDLAYLEQHFKQLQTTPNAVPLAGEFTGFIKEKQRFYAFLPETLEINEPWLKQYSKEIAQAFKQANYFLSKNPKQWDMDGISMIGNIYEPLSRLSKKL